MSKLVIIQPWFSAVGHPAQSLINTANILNTKEGIVYLISMVPHSEKARLAKEKLRSFGTVLEYKVNTDSLREGTLKALFSLRKLFTAQVSIEHLFFLDAHLVLLAILWPFFYVPKIKTLSVVYLIGPERITVHRSLKYLVARFLKRREVVLFLRTEELASAWQTVFPHARIKCLPSLELPFDAEAALHDQTPSETVRLGVLGQIRTGKSLEWLVPLFRNDPALGVLTVAGTFNNQAEKKALNVLEGFETFQDKFLTEEELIGCALRQDYLLMLYDKWDHRMEGAVMFLAARVNRPVIVFDKGWCGRMVLTFGNGMFAPEQPELFSGFVKNLPKSGSMEYKKLLEGVAGFKSAHNGELLRNTFLEAIQGNHVS